METYGDTIVKLAATLFAYDNKKDDPKAGEGDIEALKVIFVTNFHLFRVGTHKQIQRFVKTKKDLE
jgi:dsRNA-specific ribonuclease